MDHNGSEAPKDFSHSKKTDAERTAEFEAFEALSRDLAFSITRNDRRGRTFSADKLDDVCDSIRTYIWAQVKRRTQHHGAPSKMTVNVHIDYEN